MGRTRLPILAFLPAALAAATVAAQGGRLPIAVTVDDLPVAPPGAHSVEQQETITRRLLTTLARHEIQAVGFVNTAKLEVEGEVEARRVALLEAWLEAGHALGNHGHAHLDLHRVGPERWLADVRRGEDPLRELLARHGERLRWFRHPFLHTGRSRAVRERVEGALAERGYRIAPVTLDNGEWLYGGAYAEAFERGDGETMRRCGTDYVRYMLEVVDFYEGQTEAIVGRPIPHVLLVHAYALNADWLDELLAALEARGATWVPLASALEDPVYERPTGGYTGPGGITWLHRWAITAGLDRSIFAGEPEVPGWVRELAGH